MRCHRAHSMNSSTRLWVPWVELGLDQGLPVCVTADQTLA